MTSSIQWLQYSIVPDIFVEFYQKSYNAISATTQLGSISMIIMILPVTFLVELRSTRFVLLLGTTLSFVGAVIKCFSVDPERYWLLMCGQALVEINMPIVLSLPPKIAASWFPNNELGRAISISVFGDQIGIAISYLVPFIVKGPVNTFGASFPQNWSNFSLFEEKATQAIQEVSQQAYQMSFFTAGISFLTMIAVYLLFEGWDRFCLFYIYISSCQ